MRKISFLAIFFITTNCFALTSEEFEDKFVDLNSTKQKASMSFYFNSQDYDDPKIPAEDKLKSKQSWCELTKARLNLLEFNIENFPEYKAFLKRTNQEDNSTLDDFKKFSKMQKQSYILLKNELQDTEYKCD